MLRPASRGSHGEGTDQINLGGVDLYPGFIHQSILETLDSIEQCFGRFYNEYKNESPFEVKAELSATEKQVFKDRIEQLRRENRDLTALNIHYKKDIDRLVEKVRGSVKRGDGPQWEREQRAKADSDSKGKESTDSESQ